MLVNEIVDFHSHILPNVDHGSRSLKTTEFQLRSAYSLGIKKIVSTSHFYPSADTVNTFLKRRDESYRLVVSSIEQRPEIRLAAEVLICNGLERLPGLDKLFIQGTNTLLLELPFSSFDSSLYKTVQNLLGLNINIIIAHANRYDRALIEKLVSIGVKLQLNAYTASRKFNKKNMHVLDWINSEYVVALGSDIHGKDKKAYPNLIKAFENVGSKRSYIIEESMKIWDESKEYSPV